MALLLSDADLFVNDELLIEYEKYIHKALGFYHLYMLLQNRTHLIDPSHKNLEICRRFFPEGQYADIVHAATCLETGAIMITNDNQ